MMFIDEPQPFNDKGYNIKAQNDQQKKTAHNMATNQQPQITGIKILK